MNSFNLPRVSFGVIVLNGEPFTCYNLRALYPFAHQIIVVEGAAPGAANIATPDGHSTDGTLEVLRCFKLQEDPEDKLIIVTAEDEGHPDGFWPGEKDEQSQAYATRATGDYLWQIDIDEFYQPEDIQTILKMLQNEPEITALSFKMITFWGGFDYTADGWYLWQGAEIYRRLFKWGQGYQYITHRPPTVYDFRGRDLCTLKPMRGYETAKLGIFLYHYSLLFPKQVLDKTNYYSRAGWASHARQAQEWTELNYLQLNNPFRVHNVYQHISWLESYHGQHPPEIDKLRRDIKAGNVVVQLRQTDDIERLLALPWYRLARLGLKIFFSARLYLRSSKKKMKTILGLKKT